MILSILLFFQLVLRIETFKLHSVNTGGKTWAHIGFRNRLFASVEKKETEVANKVVLSNLSPVIAVVSRKDDKYLLTTEMMKIDDSTLQKARMIQEQSNKIPRSYLSTVLLIEEEDSPGLTDSGLQSLLESNLCWFFDGGGKPSQLLVHAPKTLQNALSNMGLEVLNSKEGLSTGVLDIIETQGFKEAGTTFTCSVPLLHKQCAQRLKAQEGDPYTLHNLLGRLNHAAGKLPAAVESYTQALTLQPKSAATFRNMGAAYHALGNTQLAFASYQQALSLDPSDALVYLKLAFFYEDFASKDWVDAGKLAEQCYRYYLEQVDAEDTTVLSRLAALLVKEGEAAKALEVFSQINTLDPSLVSAWFNKAHAQIKLKDYLGAAESLKKTVQLDSSIAAAHHMLRALDEEEAAKTTSVDPLYVRELYDQYAPSYDDHGKKMLYAAPRVLRQELAKIYKSFYNEQVSSASPTAESTAATPRDGFTETALESLNSQREMSERILGDKEMLSAGEASHCTTYTSFMNSSLDVLDLGCGTGLAGAWLKDYSKTLTGVDLSPRMLEVAKRKTVYSQLFEMPISQYFQQRGLQESPQFDLVVAVDVFNYIGDVRDTFAQVNKALRRNGLFAFTVEALSSDQNPKTDRGFLLKPNGRFAFDRKYLTGAIEQMGGSYRVLMDREFAPRIEEGQPTPGYLYIIQKTS